MGRQTELGRSRCPLDDYLRATMRRVQRKFPEAGILFVSVEDGADEESNPEITYMTNMDREEVAEIASVITDPSCEARPERAALH